MDYSKLSDQEINMAVAAITHPESTVIESKSRPPCACITGHLPSYWVDPCNSPADAWPIIADSKISLHAPRHKEGWMAEFTGSDEDVNDGFDVDYFESHHANPLRAAMIVFLKMQESANVPANSTGPDIR